MANVLGSFTHPGSDGLPIRVLDGDQNTGLFNHPNASGLPLAYLLTESHEVLGTTTCALQASGAMTSTAVEPVNLPLVLQTRGQVGPHAASTPLALQTFGDLTFAEARGHVQLALNQTVPSALTSVAAHADSMSLSLVVAASTGLQANIALVLSTSGSAAARGSASLALAVTGGLSFASVASGNASLLLAVAGVLNMAPQADAALIMATFGDLQAATQKAETQIALAVAGLLQQGVRASFALALATSGNVPRDVTGAVSIVLLMAGQADAGNTALGNVGLALSMFGGASLNTNPELARLGSLATLHPSIAGQPGGTSYE